MSGFIFWHFSLPVGFLRHINFVMFIMTIGGIYMSSEWKKNPEVKNVNLGEWKKATFGTTELPEVAHHLGEYKIPKMKEVADMISNAIKRNDFIQIIGDYDTDGVMSCAELIMIFRYYGHTNYDVRIPYRMTNGYGLSNAIVDEILKKPIGLCILVDNGIAAAEQVENLRNMGWDIIILDHHLAPEDGILPDADIIIDPEAIEGQADFTHYCGAGLVYKLAEIMCSGNKTVLNKILSFAAIATVGDSVPLVDEKTHTYENWLIVKEGMKTMIANEYRTQGLHKLLRAVGCDTKIDESDIGFKVVPCINAAGRLFDDGAYKALELLVSDGLDLAKYDEMAQELCDINNQRKTIQNTLLDEIEEEVKITGVNHNILVLYKPDIKEGILGIIAGNIANEFNVSTIVLTDSVDEGEVKGSARSVGDFDMKAYLDSHKELLKKYGGHKAAAGLTIETRNGQTTEECALTFKKVLEKDSGEYKGGNKERYYDFEISEAEAQAILNMQKLYAPYGVGNKAPVFCMKKQPLVQKFGCRYKILGATQNTIKLNLKSMYALNFTGKGKQSYVEEGFPETVDLIGTLSENSYNGVNSIQMIFDDIKASN